MYSYLFAFILKVKWNLMWLLFKRKSLLFDYLVWYFELFSFFIIIIMSFGLRFRWENSILFILLFSCKKVHLNMIKYINYDIQTYIALSNKKKSSNYWRWHFLFYFSASFWNSTNIPKSGMRQRYSNLKMSGRDKYIRPDSSIWEVRIVERTVF